MQQREQASSAALARSGLVGPSGLGALHASLLPDARRSLPAIAYHNASRRPGLEHLSDGSLEGDTRRNTGERRHDQHGSEDRGDQRALAAGH